MPRIAYRVGQFRSAIGAQAEALDDAPARAILPTPLWDAFREQGAGDRRHALGVLASLLAAGYRPETDEPLLQAALLHDVGKANTGITVVHRILRVLLTRLAPPLWRWLAASATGWRRPFWALANHAARGAVWVRTAGASPELEALVRYHDLPAPPAWAGTPLGRWHAALKDADDIF